MTTDYQEINGLGRTRLPLSRSKQLLRTIIHLLSYHFILKQRRTTVTHAAGFRLALRPTVFHPRYFLTSEFFATFIGSIDLTGKRVADVGTGSGILALAAARAGAASVVAIDINPNAAGAAAENAHANGFSKRVTAVASNLLSALAPRPLFDVILSSLPRLPANRAMSPIGPGTPVRTIGTSRCCSIRRARGSRPAAVCTCSFRQILTSIYSEVSFATRGLGRGSLRSAPFSSSS